MTHPACTPATSRSRIVPAAPRPLALEARFMFDGAAVATAVEVLAADLPAVDPKSDATVLSLAYAVQTGGKGITREASHIGLEDKPQTLDAIALLDMPSGGYGNDALVRLEIDGATYFGWISGETRDRGSYYFWTDPDFKSAQAALDGWRSEGQKDDDKDNVGFILTTQALQENTAQIHSSLNIETLRSLLPRPNTAPEANPDTASLLEDDVLGTGNFLGNVLSNDTDADDGDSLSVTGFTINGTPYAPGATATLAGQGSFTLDTSGNYTFTPEPNFHGTLPVIDYGIADSRGATASAALSINVLSVNDPPTSSDDTVTLDEDTVRTLGVSDFGTFADIDSTGLAAVRVESWSGSGTWEYREEASGPWRPLQAGTVLTRAVLDSGGLRFTPDAQAWGRDYARLDFRVSDGIGWSQDPNTLTLHVDPTNDVPEASPDTASLLEDDVLGNFLGNVLGNDTDADGDSLTVTGFTINGTFYATGTTATLAGQGSFTLDTAGKYTFKPLPNFYGTLPTIDYGITDGRGATASATLSINVLSVNDPPASEPFTITLPEDGIYRFSASDFAFSDASDSPPNTFSEVVLASLPTNGTLYYDGQPVTTAGQVYSATKIDKLTFVPAPDAFSATDDSPGSLYTTFSFRVRDSGGQARGGVDQSADNQVSVIVRAVNDLPTSSDDTVTLDEDTVRTLGVSDFGTFTDIDSTDLAAVRVESWSGSGTWEYREEASGPWTPLQAGTVLTRAVLDSGGLRFTPDAQAWGRDYARLDFRVSDGIGWSQDPNTLTLHVDPTNDVLDVADLTPETVTAGEILNLQDITISDPDGNQDLHEVIVSVDSGTLDASLLDSSAAGHGTNTVTLSGSPAYVSQQLTLLRYVAPPTQAGTATLTVSATDSGGSSDSESTTITVRSSTLGSTPPPAPAPEPPLLSTLPPLLGSPSTGSGLGSAPPPPVLGGSAASAPLPTPIASPVLMDPAPPPHTPQVFDSTLFPQRAGLVVMASDLIEPSASQVHPLQRTLALWTFNDAYTEAPEDGWRVVVHPDTGSLLSVFRGMPDQFIEGDGVAYVSVPWDSFFHTHSDVRVTVHAALADGLPLPAWIQLNSDTGVFQLVPPRGFLGELVIRLQARDNQGREASTLFRLQVGERAPASPREGGITGRSALSEQLRDAARERQSTLGTRPLPTAAPLLQPS